MPFGGQRLPVRRNVFSIVAGGVAAMRGVRAIHEAAADRAAGAVDELGDAAGIATDRERDEIGASSDSVRENTSSEPGSIVVARCDRDRGAQASSVRVFASDAAIIAAARARPDGCAGRAGASRSSASGAPSSADQRERCGDGVVRVAVTDERAQIGGLVQRRVRRVDSARLARRAGASSRDRSRPRRQPARTRRGSRRGADLPSACAAMDGGRSAR